MDNAGRFIAVTFAVLALFSDCRHCQKITQGPSNSTVLSGSQARFNCTVTEDWKTIIWFHFEALVPVLIIDRNAGVQNIASRFSALNYTAPGVFTSELILLEVRVNDIGLIRCNVFSSLPSDAFLTVQVNGTLDIVNKSLTVVANERALIVCQASGWLPAPQITWKTNTSLVDPANYSTVQSDVSDGFKNAVSTLNLTFAKNETVTCLAKIETLPVAQSATESLTVVEKLVEASKLNDNTKVIIIAVVVTIGGLLLIIIIVVIVICCCRRRRKKEESSYQSQMKKVSAQRTNNLSTVSKNVAGSASMDNEDPPAYRRPLPKVPSESSTSLNYFDTEQKYGGNPASEVRRSNNEPQYPVNSVHSSRPAQLRHLTHV